MNAINGQRHLPLASNAESEPEPAPVETPVTPEMKAELRRHAQAELDEIADLDRNIAELDDATEFDWNDSADVFLEEQPRTAAYINKRRQLVIRQERGPLEEDDTFVYFNRDAIEPLIATLKYWQDKLA